jgi:hypothetical protein
MAGPGSSPGHRVPAHRRALPDPSLPSSTAIVLDAFRGDADHYGAETGVRMARKHLAWYSKGLPARPSSAPRSTSLRCRCKVRTLIRRVLRPLSSGRRHDGRPWPPGWKPPDRTPERIRRAVLAALSTPVVVIDGEDIRANLSRRAILRFGRAVLAAIAERAGAVGQPDLRADRAGAVTGGAVGIWHVAGDAAARPTHTRCRSRSRRSSSAGLVVLSLHEQSIAARSTGS